MNMKAGLVAAMVCFGALMLSACGGKSGPIGLDPGIKIAPLSALPNPEPSDRLLTNTAYLVGAFDTIEIDVYGVPEMKRSVAVDASGTFSFPLAGDVQAAGLTPRQIAAELARKLGAYVKNPQVTVNVTAMVSQNLTVDGQVNKPGQYPVVGRQTLMRAIAVAGGTADYAKLDDVVIFRTVQGQRYVGLYNLQAIRRGNYGDPEVFANDIVIVGDSPARRRFETILQTLPAITAPIVILTQLL